MVQANVESMAYVMRNMVDLMEANVEMLAYVVRKDDGNGASKDT